MEQTYITVDYALSLTIMLTRITLIFIFMLTN